MAWLCLGAAAAIAPLTYALGRAVWGGEREARVAALLAAASPVMLLFAFTSADAVFAALGTATAALLARAAAAPGSPAQRCSRSRRCSPGRCWPSARGPRCWPGGRERLARARPGSPPLCAIAVVGFQALLAVVYGYDPVAELRATHDVTATRWPRSAPTGFGSWARRWRGA